MLDRFETGLAAIRLRPRQMYAQWDGDSPALGDYLLAEKGRKARRIIGVRRCKRSQARTPLPVPEPRQLPLDLQQRFNRLQQRARERGR